MSALVSMNRVAVLGFLVGAALVTFRGFQVGDMENVGVGMATGRY